MGGGASKAKKKGGPMEAQIGNINRSDDSSSLAPSVSQGSSYQSSTKQAHSDAQGSSVSDIEISSMSSAGGGGVRAVDSRMSIDLSDSEDDKSGDSNLSKKPMTIKKKPKAKAKGKGK